ncbi:YbhB/YbcL family Raf kinase inhibitor-like protein [Patescibacteria group bacterium]
MKISSSAFESEGLIPEKYTCDGVNVNPPLLIEEVPEGTKTLALIVDDPDAPVGIWVHWLVWNIPPDTTEIQENSKPSGTEGTTSFGTVGYGGPCPPSGTHRYLFKVFALDTEIDLDSKGDKASLESRMEGHIIDKVMYMGKYSSND